MGIRVVEQFVEAKCADRVCEDLIVTTDDFAAVIDGASDATGARFAGKAGGRLAAESVASTISNLPATADARTFADAATADLAAAVTAAVGVLGPDTRWPVAVVTCASAHRREVWRIGNGNLVVQGTEYTGIMRVDEAAYSFRAVVNAALLSKGTSLESLIENDPGAAGARLLIDNQQHLANRVGPWGYGCINGRQIPDEYLEVMSLPDGSVEVIITSDGYPVVHPTLVDTEATLTQMMSEDPAAIGKLWSLGKPTKPGANAPDDRAYLRFVVD